MGYLRPKYFEFGTLQGYVIPEKLPETLRGKTGVFLRLVSALCRLPPKKWGKGNRICIFFIVFSMKLNGFCLKILFDWVF